MHLGFDLCAEEQAFLSKRKQVVAKALKQALQIDRDLQEDEVWENRALERDSLISYILPQILTPVSRDWKEGMIW